MQKQDLILEDRNSTLLDKSYLNIKTETDHVQLVIERSQLGETGSREAAAKEPLVITGFEIHNETALNLVRLGFFWVIFGLGFFFFRCRKWIGTHIEIGFAAVCLSVGILMIAALPVSKVGYDEETHFMRSMEIASIPWGMNVSSAVWSKMIPVSMTGRKISLEAEKSRRLLRTILTRKAIIKTAVCIRIR